MSWVTVTCEVIGDEGMQRTCPESQSAPRSRETPQGSETLPGPLRTKATAHTCHSDLGPWRAADLTKGKDGEEGGEGSGPLALRGGRQPGSLRIRPGVRQAHSLPASLRNKCRWQRRDWGQAQMTPASPDLAKGAGEPEGRCGRSVQPAEAVAAKCGLSGEPLPCG